MKCYLPIASTRNGDMHRIEPKRIPPMNKNPRAVALAMNGQMQANSANEN